MRSIGFKVSANMENRFSGRGNLRLVNRLAPCFILLWILSILYLWILSFILPSITSSFYSSTVTLYSRANISSMSSDFSLMPDDEDEEDDWLFDFIYLYISLSFWLWIVMVGATSLLSAASPLIIIGSCLVLLICFFANLECQL